MADWSQHLTTHTGFTFYVRPATPEDETALGTFFKYVTPEDLRFRFLSSLKAVSHEQLVAMTRVDHQRTESFLAFEREDGPIIAAAMLACDAGLDVGEVAVSTSADYKDRGVSWELLGHLMRYAQAKGVKQLQSVEHRSNRPAIQLEKELGFTSETYQGDSTLVLLRKNLTTSSLG